MCYITWVLMLQNLSQEAIINHSSALGLRLREGPRWEAEGREGAGRHGRLEAASNGDVTSNGDVIRLGDERVHILREEIYALTVTRDRLLAETEGLLVCVCE